MYINVFSSHMYVQYMYHTWFPYMSEGGTGYPATGVADFCEPHMSAGSLILVLCKNSWCA